MPVIPFGFCQRFLSPWRHPVRLLGQFRAAQRAAPGLVIPPTKQLGNLDFRGAAVHVQTLGLKTAAHVVGMLPAPAAPAFNAREFGASHIVSSG